MKMVLTVSPVVMAAILFVSCPELAAAAEGEHHGGNQLVDLGWRVVNFIIFATILYFAAAKPVRNFLRGRVDGIKKQLADAEREKDEAERKLKDCLKKLEGLEEEIKEIKETLIREGEVERERIIEAAEAAAEKIREQARFSAEQELGRAVAAIREETAEAAVALAERLLVENVGKDDQRRLTTDYIVKLEGGS